MHFQSAVVDPRLDTATIAEIPGLSICQIVRREGMDAIFVSRWSWDGRERKVEADPVRRFPESPALGE